MEVWCVGDLTYFVAVLNSLAMVASSGLFEDLVKLGMILSVLYMGFEAMLGATGRIGSGIPYARFILAFIAFKLMFGMTTTATVYDTYSLKAMDVDNVPYGVLTAGSIMSKTSHEITATMEQAFSTPNLTTTGFATPLEILSRGKRLAPGLDTLEGGRVKRTLVEYVEKCTSVGINLGQVSDSQLRTTEDPWAAMRWHSEIYYTMTWLPGEPEAGTLRSCTEAWDVINDYLHGQLWTDWEDFLRSVICPTESCDPASEVQEALNNLNLMEQNAYDYMLAAVLLPVFEQGQIQFNSFMGKPELAIITGQAREQRNTQWKLEGTMFMNIVRPLMAFFEGFLYASAPFMALLVAFVPAGLGLVYRYFQMFCWHQLWLPVLAILNHYTQIVAQQKLTALVSGGIPLTSLNGYLIGMSQIDDWLSVAGLLVASTPAIALALLYGGSVAMTHLAGRLQSGDFVDENVAAPKIASPPPYMNIQSPYSQIDTRGVYASGTPEIVPKLNISDVVANAQASSRQEVAVASRDFSATLQKVMGKSIAASYGGTATEGFREGFTGNVTETEALAHGLANKIGSSLNLNTQERHTLQGIVDGGMKQGRKSEAGGASIGAQMGAQLQGAFGQEKGQAIAEALDNLVTQSGESSLQAAGMQTMARDFARQQTQSYLTGLSQNDLEQLQQSAAKKLSAEQQYQETSQAVQQVGFASSLGLMEMARLAMQTQGSVQEYWSKLGFALPGFQAGPNRMGERVNRLDELSRQYKQTVTDPEQARWMATIHRLQEYQGPGQEVAQKKLAELVMGAVGRGLPVSQAGQFKGVAGQVEPAGQAAFDKAQSLKPVADVQEGIAGIKGQTMAPLPTEGDVRAWQTDWGNFVDEQRFGEAKKGWSDKYARSIDAAYEQFTKDPTTSQVLTEGAAAFNRWAEKRMREMKAFGTSVYDAVTSLDISKINWPGAYQDFYKYAVGRGMTPDQARLYAEASIASIDAWTRNQYGISIANTDSYKQAQADYIAKKAGMLQERGMSPADSQRVAQREAHMIAAAGITGMNYLERVDVGEKDWQRLQKVKHTMGPAGRYEHLIRDSAQRHGLDPDLLRALIKQESGFNPHATSPKGAMGLGQLMPGTARALGVKDPYDPAQNIEGSAKYLREMLNQFGGSYEKALAAYNAGPERVRQAGGIPPIKETQDYVRAVMGELRGVRQGTPTLARK